MFEIFRIMMYSSFYFARVIMFNIISLIIIAIAFALTYGPIVLVCFAATAEHNNEPQNDFQQMFGES